MFFDIILSRQMNLSEKEKEPATEQAPLPLLRNTFLPLLQVATLLSIVIKLDSQCS